MRNFTSIMSRDCVFAIGANDGFRSPTFVRIQEALVITMGANPEMMTPGEESVLADFIGWYMRCKEDFSNEVPYRAPLFAYHNLNEGHSMAVMIVNDEGAVPYFAG